MSFLQALLQHSVLQYAMLAAIFASIAGGVVGSYVVIKRLSFISGGIAHSILGGIGFSVWLKSTFAISWISPLMGALIAGLLSALILGWIHLNYREREDSVIAAIWSIGMALGILFLSNTPGPKIELGNYLVGNILWVTSKELWLLLILNVLILAVVAFTYNRLLTLCFDETQAKLQGVSVKVLYFVLLGLIATTIVLLMQIVGAILVITMLVVPATIANLFTRFLPAMMFIAVLINIVFSYFGLFFAYHLSWPAGATIALLAGSAYVIALFIKSKRLKLRA
ncbi:MAG: Manganese transport system membrane protein MntB [Chlamydiae bacterium]|nr:Manganese transport system membrane protein MntB [Chlamydiota bacterium]